MIGRTPLAQELLSRDHHYQAVADAARGPVPPIGDDYQGPVTTETYAGGELPGRRAVAGA